MATADCKPWQELIALPVANLQSYHLTIEAIMKKCASCHVVKSTSEFHKHSQTKDGLRAYCKSCRAEKRKQQYEKNKESYLAQCKEYYLQNKKKKLAQNKDWKEKNKEYYRAQQQAYAKENRDIIQARKTEMARTCPRTNLILRVRGRTAKAFSEKGYKKDSETFALLGCSKEHLIDHIERQFLKGMSWDNRAKWQIDHIIPLASANTKEDIVKLCHYTNLRPIWTIDNLEKGSKMEFLI